MPQSHHRTDPPPECGGPGDAITATQGRDPDAHVEAMLSALAWYREEPVEHTAVPADLPSPRVVEGRCSWCGNLQSAHEGGVREHRRIEVVRGRYDDEPKILDPPCLPVPVDPECEVGRRILDVARDLFTVLDAHGYQRTSDHAALSRAVAVVCQLVDEYEGHADRGTAHPRPDR